MIMIKCTDCVLFYTCPFKGYTADGEECRHYKPRDNFYSNITKLTKTDTEKLKGTSEELIGNKKDWKLKEEIENE
jgi:hypothetical protein